MRAVTAGLLLVMFAPVARAELPDQAPLPPPKPKRAPTCADTIGRKRASDLLALCREVAAKPGLACRSTVRCGPVRDEVRRGCREAGSDAPPACQALVEADEDEDDEDEED